MKWFRRNKVPDKTMDSAQVFNLRLAMIMADEYALEPNEVFELLHTRGMSIFEVITICDTARGRGLSLADAMHYNDEHKLVDAEDLGNPPSIHGPTP